MNGGGWWILRRDGQRFDTATPTAKISNERERTLFTMLRCNNEIM